MTSIDLSQFESPAPPPFLFKYLHPDRIGNVLEEGTFRFAPLLGTNDPFEVRRTFDKLVGPRFLELLRAEMENALSPVGLEKLMREQLREAGLGMMHPEQANALVKSHYGLDFSDLIRQVMPGLLSEFMSHVNKSDAIDDFLTRMSGRLHCFSLSEEVNSPPMWAHYANNGKGFVLSLKTSHPWFNTRSDGLPSRLQKVSYTDETLEEPLQDFRSAFVSKATSWSYEKEWRIYAKAGQIDRTVGSTANPIHLVEFPPDMVERVILGNACDQADELRIRDLIEKKYPLAKITRLTVNRSLGDFQEVSVT